MTSLRTTLLLALSLALAQPAPAWAQSASANASMRGGAFEHPISVTIQHMPLRDAIRLVAQKGRLNVAVEDDLTGNVTVSFARVRLGDALSTLITMGGAQAFWRGNVFAVVSRRRATERGLIANTGQVFKLRYASASRVAEMLNTSLLVRAYQAGTTTSSAATASQAVEIARADTRSNTVLVFGSNAEVELAGRLIQAIDVEPEKRLFHLSHANAAQVASFLNATVFHLGHKASASTESLRVDAEQITEGSGGMALGSGVQLMQQQGGTIRTRTSQTQTVPVDSKLPIAVPDSRLNSVLVMGTPEAIALAQDVIARLDRKPTQVSIEVEVIEVHAEDGLELGTSMAGAKSAVSSTFQPADPTQPGWSIIYDPANLSPGSFRARLNALVSAKKAKILAHPTVIAADNTESQINLVDEVIKGTRISSQSVTVNNQAMLIVEPIFGAAGVTLNILPQIGADGTVSLRLHPTISSVRETIRDSANNQITLLSRRELMAQQVIVPSGKTLTLGGLTQTQRIETRHKLPLLGEIPVLGHLFGTTSSQDRKTELILTVTPRILPQ